MDEDELVIRLDPTTWAELAAALERSARVISELAELLRQSDPWVD